MSRLGAGTRTEFLYLGQSSGRIGEWIQTLPFIGKPFGRYLVGKSKRVHQRNSAPPDNITALVIYLLSRWRVFKFRRMLRKCNSGVLMITDRYPQTEVAGFRFDGPQLAKTMGGNKWVRMLRSHEQALYRWMAGYLPMLVIRMNVDLETAHQRKPDHSITALKEKIAVYPDLAFNGARILDLDSTAPLEEIIQRAMDEVHELEPSLRDNSKAV